MKKKFLFAFCAILFTWGSVYAQQKEYSHWSLDLKGGVNRGEFSAGGNLTDGQYSFSLGVELERTFNPLWGMALDYEFVSYKAPFDLDGTAHEVALLGSVNLSNLLAKYRHGNWQKLNVYGRLGGGFSFYNGNNNSGSCVVLPLSASVEYDVSKHVAIGLSGERRWHTSSTLGMGQALEDRIVIWSALANVRFKFGAGKNDHIRNTKLTDYDMLLAAEEHAYDDAPIKKEIANHDNAINQLKDQLNKANSDLGKLNNDLSKANSDLNKTKEDLAKCCQEKANAASAAGNASTMGTPQKNIEFEIDKYTIQPAYKAELDAIAAQMEKQPSQKLTLVGHTDNSGSEQLNEALSLNRAKAVSSYLVKKGVNAENITTKGMAATQPIATNETAEGRQQNRRVEFIFATK